MTGGQFVGLLGGMCVLFGTAGAEAKPFRVRVKAVLPGAVQPNDYSSIAGIALSPDESKVYAAQWSDTNSDPIVVFSTTDHTRIDQISHGRCHKDVVLSLDGRFAFTGSYYQGEVTRIDLANDHELASLKIGAWVTYLWMAPSGKQLLVQYGDANGSARTSLAIVSIDGGAFGEVRVVPLGRHGLSDWGSGPVAFSADGSHVYVPTASSESESALLVDISLDLCAIARSLALRGDSYTGVVRIGDVLFVSSKDAKTITAIDLSTFQALPDTIELKYSPNRIALHPDGKHLFVLHPHDNAISIVNLRKGSGYVAVSDLNSPSDIEFTSDGKTAYVGNMYGCGGPARGGVTVLTLEGEKSSKSSSLDSSRSSKERPRRRSRRQKSDHWKEW